jgi:hypothetical protein
LSLALIALATGGCSTMSETECQAVEWRTIGYEDGVAGYPGSHIAKHRKACAKYGVRPDLALYQQGREEGLREHCQPANGYRIGVRGGSYGGICPADLEPAFVSAFEEGRQLYTLEARLANAESQLHAKRKELDRVQHDIVESSAAAVSKDSTGQQRADAVVDTANLAERAGRLKEEIRKLESDRARYELDLDEYRASHSR